MFSRLMPPTVPLATTFADLLGRPVRMEPVPRETWESLFKSQGMKNPTPRIKMLDGFNEGWTEFETAESGPRKGRVAREPGLQTLIESGGKSGWSPQGGACEHPAQ